jgi:hypothetical protein
MHPENETRLISLTVTDTREQTRDILASLAKGEAEGTDLTPWHAIQEWLAGPAAERRVTIPYAPALAKLVPPVAVRLRRDFGVVLNLIRAHAVLHQASREKNGEGHIVATLDDYARVRDLVEDLISEGVEATVPQSVREVVEAAMQLHEEEGEPVTTAALARELELDRSAASRRVRAAKDRGYLRDLEDNPRKPSRILPGDHLPDELEILPAPEALSEACTRAVRTEGINTPLPPQTGEDDNRREESSYPSRNDARLHAQEEAGESQDNGLENGRVRFTL